MKKNELTTIYLDSVAREEKNKWKDFEFYFQENVTALSKHINTKFSTAEQIAEIAPEWLEKQIEQSRKNLTGVLGAGCFVPAAIAKQFNDNYNAIKRTCTPIAESIMSEWLHLTNRGVAITIDENGVPHLNPNDVQRCIDEAATRTFTEKQKEGWGYLSAVTKALNNLRLYEKAQKLIPSQIITLLSEANHAHKLNGEDTFTITPAAFYHAIAYGRILRPETTDEAPFDENTEIK